MTETAPAGHPDSREWRALAGARRLGAACETAAWPYGDRLIGPSRSSASTACSARLTTCTPAAAKRLTCTRDAAIVGGHYPAVGSARRSRSAGALFNPAFGRDSVHAP